QTKAEQHAINKSPHVILLSFLAQGHINPLIQFGKRLASKGVSVPGLPQLEGWETPSFVHNYGAYPAWSDMVFNQFANIDQAHWVFTNTFYHLEKHVTGPTIPSMYLDKRLEDDKDYGLSLFNTNHNKCMNWLNDKRTRSVVYVSFGSVAQLELGQMKEIAWALIDSDVNFLWVVRDEEKDKLPKDLIDERIKGKGLVVSWCKQLDVLKHESVGCFVTHCGFNSTLEALCLGVPVIEMPQWTNQITNANCPKECEMELAKLAVDKGGSSDKDIDEFDNTMKQPRPDYTNHNQTKCHVSELSLHKGRSINGEVVVSISDFSFLTITFGAGLTHLYRVLMVCLFFPKTSHPHTKISLREKPVRERRKRGIQTRVIVRDLHRRSYSRSHSLCFLLQTLDGLHTVDGSGSGRLCTCCVLFGRWELRYRLWMVTPMTTVTGSRQDNFPRSNYISTLYNIYYCTLKVTSTTITQENNVSDSSLPERAVVGCLFRLMLIPLSHLFFVTVVAALFFLDAECRQQGFRQKLQVRHRNSSPEVSIRRYGRMASSCFLVLSLFAPSCMNYRDIKYEASVVIIEIANENLRLPLTSLVNRSVCMYNKLMEILGAQTSVIGQIIYLYFSLGKAAIRLIISSHLTNINRNPKAWPAGGHGQHPHLRPSFFSLRLSLSVSRRNGGLADGCGSEEDICCTENNTRIPLNISNLKATQQTADNLQISQSFPSTMAEQHKMNKPPHVLLFPFPAQGHINPIIQFGKRLLSKGVKITLVTTIYILNTNLPHKENTTPITIEAISDGFDEGGYASADSSESYLKTFKEVGSKSLGVLIKKLQSQGDTIDAIIYDAFISWALDVAMEFGIDGGSFFTQACSVNNIYYHVHKGLISLPLSVPVSVPGLPQLECWETPSFVHNYGPYPGWSEIVFNQFCNIDQARWVFTNSFYKLEEEVIEWMRKMWNLKVIGPTLPSMYLDKRIHDDKDYGFNLFKENHNECKNWLYDKPKKSVVYVSFGSSARLGPKQMEEIAWGLSESNVNFLWVVRAEEAEKLPNEFVNQNNLTEKGLVVAWCRQLDVLAHESIGCFVTHCGFNSTLEAISLGVPVVGMPQWTDQTTNAKLLDEIWGVGVRVKANENGIVTRGNLVSCIKKIMEDEKGAIAQKNAMKWREAAKEAVDEGGSSYRDIDEFINELKHEF
ncbi:hypothetical protein M8C21_026258, partial [Ambrosia artemisiifolia]